MEKYIHNTSGATKSYIGTEIADTVYYLIPPLLELKYMEDANLIADITAGDVFMSRDGATDLSTADSLTFLAYRAEALEQRFRDDSERSNGFVSKNVQDAIEEARNSAIGTVLEFEFSAGGANVSDSWLAFADPSAPSNDVPLVVPQMVDIKGVVFSNKDDNSYTDIEVYINAVLSFTVVVSDKRTYYDVGATKGTAVQGDRISVFLKKNGSTARQPSKPVVVIYAKIVGEKAGTGGTTTGV